MARSIKKESALVAISLSCTLLTVYLAAKVGAQPHLLTISLLIVVGLVWVALMACALAFVKNIYAIMILLLGLSILLMAAGRIALGAVAAATLLLVIVAMARWRILGELNERLHYRTVNVFYPGTRWLAFGLLIIIAGLALPFFVESLTSATISIPEVAVHYLLKPAEPAIQEATPGYAPAVIAILSDSINQYIENITRISPITAALILLTTLLLAARLLVPLLAWPALLVLSLLIAIGRQTGFLSLVSQEKNVEQLVL